MRITVNRCRPFGTTRRGRAVALALLLAVAGCGGSDGGRDSPQPGPTTSSGRGTLKVTVRDVFGAPVAGAQVAAIEYSGGGRSPPPIAITDSSGSALIGDVPAGALGLEVHAAGGYGYWRGGLERGRTEAADVVLHPASLDAGGVVRAWVPEGGLSADGRTLEFKLQLSDVPGRTRIYAYYSDWADEDDDPWSSVFVEDCQPLTTNDAVVYGPDCVVGPGGFGASYAAAPSAAALELERLPEATPFWSPLGDALVIPFRTILLLEQGANVIADDSSDQRLLAAKYFLNYAGPGMFSAMLGAYATDDPNSAGGLALLPQKPLTAFPAENPVFTTDGRSYFATIDDLQAMEGGVSPLFAAIDRAIDLQVAAGGAVPRSVVVITNGGHDFTCGTRDACRAARDAVIQKSRDTGVAIVVIGHEGWYAPDWETLGLLGQGAPGSATFWAGDPSGLASTLRTVRKYLAQVKRTAIATFRIESPTPGAFASGRTVLGWVSNGGDCGFEPCTRYQRIPFAVTIP